MGTARQNVDRLGLLLLLGRCLPVLDEICKRSMNFVSTCLSHTASLVKYVAHHSIRFGLNFLMNVMFCTAQDGTVLMFPTFLQIIMDLYRILYIRVRGLRLLYFRCMRLICCLSVYLLEMDRQHCLSSKIALRLKKVCYKVSCVKTVSGKVVRHLLA